MGRSGITWDDLEKIAELRAKGWTFREIGAVHFPQYNVEYLRHYFQKGYLGKLNKRDMGMTPKDFEPTRLESFYEDESKRRAERKRLNKK